MSVDYSTNVVTNQELAESGKFVRLDNNTRFPAVSVARIYYPDKTAAFPANSAASPTTTYEIYPKYGVISYIANTDEFAVSLSAGQVNLDTTNLEAHTGNIDTNVTDIEGILNHSFLALSAIDLNTYDTLTAVVAFNNNYLATVSALSAKITNTVLVSTNQTWPISGNINVLNSLNATILNPISSFNIANTSIILPITGSITNTVAISTTQTLPVSVVNPQIEITNDSGNPVPISTTQTLPISGSVTITQPVTTILGSPALPISFADTVQIDQAGRLRVATPNTQWWYQASVDKDGDVRYNESFVAGASSIFVQNLGSVNMTSGTTSTSGQAIRASRRRHKIIPGQSHEYAGVWNWDGQQTNVVKRIGIFTQYNGYFFELSGTDMNAVVRRRLADGTVIEERVNQYAWNGDSLDGTGPSGENWNALTTTATITGWVSTTAVTPQNAIPVYNVVYGLSAGQVQNFRQGTKATITGITPSTYNAVGIIAKTDTTTNRLTATYLYNPGVSVSNATAGTMYQNGYHMQHTYWIDFMGGRTNRVRFGKQSDYGQIVLHTFRFDGLLGTAYENAPTLTERKEIYNIGSPTSLPSFTVMGNAFNVESSVDITPNFCIARNDAGVTFANVGD